MVSESELIGRLREFLRSSDLNTTTTATVRRQLENDFGIDLSDRKAFIREQVDLFLQTEHNQSSQQPEQEEEEDEEQDEEAVKSEQSQGSNSKEETEEEEQENDDVDDGEEDKPKRPRNGKKNKGRLVTFCLFTIHSISFPLK